MEPERSPVVVVLPDGSPQEVGDELAECRSVQSHHLPVHGGEVDVVLGSVPGTSNIENISGVHLVHPVGLAPGLELVPEGGDQPLQGVADKQERERGVPEQVSDVVSLRSEPLSGRVKL